MLLNRNFTLTFIIGAVMILCFTATSVGKEIEGNARVNGTINGTKVKLTTARVNDDNSILELFEGDGWGFNPSVLVFLFDDAASVAPNKSIKITPTQKGMAPHIHGRFRSGQKIEMADIKMKDYTMSIRFQKVKRGFLPAKFKLSIPDQKTELEGFFFLKQDDKK